MNKIGSAKRALLSAWPTIKKECLSVLGSELHYQAIIYHCLREAGIPLGQLGMNVKMWVDDPISDLFQILDKKKHGAFRGGFEPIPDIVIFKNGIKGDWRRRNNYNTLQNMLIAIEVKASERSGSRLQPGEIKHDLEKLAAHREEVIHRKSTMFPVMLIIDSAPSEEERMTSYAIESVQKKSTELGIGLLYCSPTTQINTIS